MTKLLSDGRMQHEAVIGRCPKDECAGDLVPLTGWGAWTDEKCVKCNCTWCFQVPRLISDIAATAAAERRRRVRDLAGQFGDGRSLGALPGLALAAWVNEGRERERFVFLLGAAVCNAGLFDERASFPSGEPSAAGKALLDVVYRTVGAPQGAAAPDLAGQIASLKDILRRIVDACDEEDGEIDSALIDEARKCIGMASACETCSDGHHDVLRPCPGCGRSVLEKRELRAAHGGTEAVLDVVIGVRPQTT